MLVIPDLVGCKFFLRGHHLLVIGEASWLQWHVQEWEGLLWRVSERLLW